MAEERDGLRYGGRLESPTLFAVLTDEEWGIDDGRHGSEALKRGDSGIRVSEEEGVPGHQWT